MKVKRDLGVEVRKGALVLHPPPAPNLSAGGPGHAHDPAQRAQRTRLWRACGSRDAVMSGRSPYLLTSPHARSDSSDVQTPERFRFQKAGALRGWEKHGTVGA